MFALGPLLGSFILIRGRWEKPTHSVSQRQGGWLRTPSGQMLTHRKAFSFFGQDQVAGREAAAGRRLGGGSSGAAGPASCRDVPSLLSRQTIVCASPGSRHLPTPRHVTSSLPTLGISVPFFYFFKQNVPVSNS